MALLKISVTLIRIFPVFFHFFRITSKLTVGGAVKTAFNWLSLKYKRTSDFREWHPWTVFRTSIF